MATTPIFAVKPVFEHELFPLIQAMTAAYNEDNGADLTTFEIQTTRVLNKIVTDSTCVRFFTTLNIDKPLFGVYVSPTIIDTELNQFIFDPNQVIFNRYSVELDRKLFDILTPEEIAAYLIEDITTTMSKGAINNTRALFNTIIADRDMTIDLKKSVNFEQLLIFGIKDTIRKVSSLLYKPVEAMGINEYAREFEYSEGVIPNIAKKLHTSLFDMNGLTVNPKLSVLSWVLTVYNEPNINYELTLDALTAAAALTGSKLEQDEVEKTITSLRRASNETLTESKVETLREGMSIFKNLKQNGLRSIEDDLYEYKIRIKNCETEDDAMYILQQINTRINILEDYLYNTADLSDREVQRWENVINAYRDLRVELGKKKIADKKRYGIYIDYSSFDKLENESAMFDAAVGDPNDKDFTETFMTEAKDEKDKEDKKSDVADKINDGLNDVRQKIISGPKTDQGKKDLEILKDICKKYSDEEKTDKLDSKVVSELEANIKKRISPDSLSKGSVKSYHKGGKVYLLPYNMKKGNSEYHVTIYALNGKFRLYKFAEKTSTKSSVDESAELLTEGDLIISSQGKQFKSRIQNYLGSQPSFSSKWSEADLDKAIDKATDDIHAKQAIKQKPFKTTKSNSASINNDYSYTSVTTTVTLNIFPYAVFTDSAFYAVALTPDRGIQEFYECLYDKIAITPDIILDLVKNFGIVIQGISKNKVLVWQDQIDNSTYRAIMQKYPNAKVDKFTGNIIFK